eukprot:scaffold800_cov197-Alexandrium_tamarense.AAC.20
MISAEAPPAALAFQRFMHRRCIAGEETQPIARLILPFSTARSPIITPGSKLHHNNSGTEPPVSCLTDVTHHQHYTTQGYSHDGAHKSLGRSRKESN